MNKCLKIGLPVVIIVVAAGLIVIKESGKSSAEIPAPPAAASGPHRGVPVLIDLGASRCIPCIKMAPILEELRNEYRDKLEVVFIDVWKNRAAAGEYGIRLIPTQIFYDAGGKELARHEGFLGKEDILDTFKRLGVPLSKPGEREGFLVGDLLVALSRAIEGTPGVALGASFIWGVLSIILSPCHLASIPLIVGFIDEQGAISTRRAFNLALLFAVGILITIGVVGTVTAALGRMMGDIGRFANYLVAGIFLVAGLHLLGIIPMPWAGLGQVGMKRRGALAAFILGLVFGIALGPCTFAYMAPMLAVTFRLAAVSLFYSLVLLLAYGVGHCSVIVAGGTFAEAVQRYLNWNERSKGTAIVKNICGGLVILGGLYLIII